MSCQLKCSREGEREREREREREPQTQVFSQHSKSQTKKLVLSS